MSIDLIHFFDIFCERYVNKRNMENISYLAGFTRAYIYNMRATKKRGYELLIRVKPK